MAELLKQPNFLVLEFITNKAKNAEKIILA